MPLFTKVKASFVINKTFLNPHSKISLNGSTWRA